MIQRRYENFELRLSAAGDEAYHVQVTASPQGEQRSPVTVSIPADEVVFPQPGDDPSASRSPQRKRARQVPYSQGPRPQGEYSAGQGLAALGKRLWTWLFPPPAEALYRAALAALPPDGGLRLRLRFDPPELAALPWELAYDPVRGRFPALSVRTPVVRYVALPYRPSALGGPTPLRVLFAGSSPSDQPAVDVAAEKARLLATLSRQRHEGRVVVDALEGGATVEALQDALRGGYRVLHFAGHGHAGALILESEDGRSHPLAADALAVLLGDSGVGLALLNACDTGAQPGGPFAGVAPALVRAGLPAVVAMQAPLPDDSARTFARNVYAALADGLPLDAAVTEGRKALALSAGMDEPDWAMPVLYLRAPDGVLWAFEDEGEAQKPRVDESGDVYESITISGGVVGAIGGRGHHIEQAIDSGQGAPATSSPDLGTLRRRLNQTFDDPGLDAFCLDHLPQVFDKNNIVVPENLHSFDEQPI